MNRVYLISMENDGHIINPVIKLNTIRKPRLTLILSDAAEKRSNFKPRKLEAVSSDYASPNNSIGQSCF